MPRKTPKMTNICPQIGANMGKYPHIWANIGSITATTGALPLYKGGCAPVLLAPL